MNQPTEGHTFHHFDTELTELHALLLNMAATALHQLRRSMEALKDCNVERAHKVIEMDGQLNAMELRADDEIMKIIARRSPVGRDLRTLLALSRITTDLERIGDEATAISEQVVRLCSDSLIAPPLLHTALTMGEPAIESMETTARLLETGDISAANSALRQKLVQRFESGVRCLITYIVEDGRNIGQGVGLLLVMKALERIGEHCQNITEHMVFMVKGEDIRHTHLAAPNQDRTV